MSVPTELLQPHVHEHVTDWEGNLIPGRLQALADRCALHYDTIQHIWSGTRDVVEFDVADRVLCAVNAVQAWYREPLRSIYTSHSLPQISVPKGRCQRVGCTKPLPEKTWGGGQPQKYCSRACRDAAARSRWRDRRGRAGRYSNPLDVCVRGHDWNDENTYISPGGKRLCRACMRINAAKQRRKKKLREQGLLAA